MRHRQALKPVFDELFRWSQETRLSDRGAPKCSATDKKAQQSKAKE